MLLSSLLLFALPAAQAEADPRSALRDRADRPARERVEQEAPPPPRDARRLSRLPQERFPRLRGRLREHPRARYWLREHPRARHWLRERLERRLQERAPLGEQQRRGGLDRDRLRERFRDNPRARAELRERLERRFQERAPARPQRPTIRT